jgi:hypothetical protein
MSKAKSKKKKGMNEGWISITQAGILLGVRYLKARDLMTQGFLGEVHSTDTGRYYVHRDDVLKYKERAAQ